MAYTPEKKRMANNIQSVEHGVGINFFRKAFVPKVSLRSGFFKAFREIRGNLARYLNRFSQVVL